MVNGQLLYRRISFCGYLINIKLYHAKRTRQLITCSR